MIVTHPGTETPVYFAIGTHTTTDGTHSTSFDVGVAVVEATGESVHYCHQCYGFADDSTVTITTPRTMSPAQYDQQRHDAATTETLAEAIIRGVREMKAFPNGFNGKWQAAYRERVDRVRAAAARAGISREDADEDFADEMEAEPVAR